MADTTLPEFMRLSGLSASDVIGMLSAGELPFVAGGKGQLMIRLDDLTAEKIACRREFSLPPLTDEQRTLIEELIASEVLRALESIIVESFDLAVSWCSKNNE